MLRFVFILGGHFQVSVAPTKLLLRGVSYVEMLNLGQIELLRSKDGAWPRNSNPANKGFSADLVVLHRIQTNESSGASKTCLAVDSDRAGSWLGKVFFAGGDKLFNDGVWGCGPVREDHVFVLDTLLHKLLLIIFGVVQTDHLRHF